LSDIPYSNILANIQNNEKLTKQASVILSFWLWRFYTVCKVNLLMTFVKALLIHLAHRVENPKPKKKKKKKQHYTHGESLKSRQMQL
jgi:hypothetical protein